MARPKLLRTVKAAAAKWSADDATRMAASLSYYTLLSIAPLIVIAIAVVGLFFGEQAARGQVASEIGGVVGPQAAEAIQTIVGRAKTPSAGIASTVIGIVVLLVGASGVFGELQYALDKIWDVEPKPNRGLRGVLRDRFFSFTMVLGVAFLLLVSLILSTVLSVLGSYFEDLLPGGAAVWQVLNAAISFGVITVLFGLIFKVVPDVKVAFRQVLPGAAATAVLFTIGMYVIGMYLGRSSVSSPYGAAGSVVVLVVWVYYSAQILFFGAELTHAWARASGAAIEPSKNAIRREDTRHLEGPMGPGRPTPAE